jgi:DNA-binding transcriptional LysR family regulator
VRLLGGFDQFVDDLTAHAEKERGSVVIAAAASFIALVLAPAATRLADRYPGIELRLIEEGTEQVTRRLLSGEVDLGITSLTRPAPGLESTVLLRDVFGVLGRRDTTVMQGDGPIRLSALSCERLVAIGRENGIRAQLDRHRGTAALMARARYEISSVAGVQNLVEQGAGVALLPSLTAWRAVTSGLCFRPLTPVIGRELHVLRRPGRELSPAAREFAHVMQEQLLTLDVPGVQLTASAGLRRFLER